MSRLDLPRLTQSSTSASRAVTCNPVCTTACSLASGARRSRISSGPTWPTWESNRRGLPGGPKATDSSPVLPSQASAAAGKRSADMPAEASISRIACGVAQTMPPARSAASRKRPALSSARCALRVMRALARCTPTRATTSSGLTGLVT